jgi:hypothetical protein
MKTHFLIIFLLPSLFSSSQNEAANWYTGGNTLCTGLNFLTSPPGLLNNGYTGVGGSGASISDANGVLLFYTDGITVVNSQHQVMANGANLNGGSVGQSALIIKKPGSSSLYFIFTLTSQVASLYYSIVDMTMAAGLGSVTVKNILIADSCMMKFTATKHCNGLDYWVVTHDLYSNSFRSFLLSSLGLNSIPMSSAVGSTFTPPCSQFQMKISPNGKKLGASYGASIFSSFELYDFDNYTGIVSNLVQLAGLQGSCGCEFSQDGSKFYGTRPNGGSNLAALYQWDLCSTNISATQYVCSVNTGTYFNKMQLAADGKIYVEQRPVTGTIPPVLGVINNPNVAGAGCNFVPAGQVLLPNGGAVPIVPNFPSNYFLIPTITPYFSGNITYTSNCRNYGFVSPAPATVTCACYYNPFSSFYWDFNDPSSGAANVSTLTTPTHSFAQPGVYNVKFKAWFGCHSDSMMSQVVVNAIDPHLSFVGSTSICLGEPVNLKVRGADVFSWQIPSNFSGAKTSDSTIIGSPTITAVFTVTGTNSPGLCTQVSHFTLSVNECLGVSTQTARKNGVELFPNPVENSLFIETQSETQVLIYNLTGQLLKEQVLAAGKTEIDLHQINGGIYTLHYENVQGKGCVKLCKIFQE